MAISTESANLVWLKVKAALDSLGAKPQAVEAFRTLKAYLSQAKANPDLQFIAMADITGDTVIADAACKFYGYYIKKQATATDAFFKMNDNATTCGAANGASATDSAPLYDIGDEAVLIYPRGRAQANGLTVASQTNLAGNTDSTSGDGPNGFIIIGKP